MKRYNDPYADTLKEFLVFVIIGAVLTVIAVPWITGSVKASKRRYDQLAAIEAGVPSPEDPQAHKSAGSYMSTLEHDAHLWVTDFRTSYFVHHPDCPCFERTAQR